MLMAILLSVNFGDDVIVRANEQDEIEYDDYYDEFIYDEDDLIEEEEEGEDEEGTDDEEEDEEIEFIDDTIALKMNVKEKWDHHYNAEVIVTNLTDDILDDWAVGFDFKNEIVNLWNAKLVLCENGEYVIKNADWNQDIPPRGSVSFGMMVRYDSEISEPEHWYIDNELQEVDPSEFEISYTQFSKWDNNVTGEVEIKNNSEKEIRDWKLDLQANFDIQQIWNADITESLNDGTYALNNKGYNANIKAHESCKFGFIAKCEEEVKITDSTLYSVVNGLGDVSGSEQEDEEYKDIVPDGPTMSMDDFENYEDYLEYLEDFYQNAPKSQSAYSKARAKKQSEATPKETAKPDVRLEYKIAGEKPEFKKRTYQNFCFNKDKSLMYAVQHIKKDAILSVFKVEEKKNRVVHIKSTKLSGYGHTQSLECFRYNKKDYLLLTGDYYKPSKEDRKHLSSKWQNAYFATKIKCIKVDTDLKNNKIKVSEKGQIKGLKYSNKSRKAFGKYDVNRVDVGLNEACDKLVIWKRREFDNHVEISTFKFTDAMKKCITRDDKNITSFAKTTVIKKSAGLSSYVMYKGTNNMVLGESVQSIDIGNDNYIYISSGREPGCKLYIGKCPVQCSSKQNPFLKRYQPKFPSDFPIAASKELEGVHSDGKRLVACVSRADAKYVYIKVRNKKNKKVEKKKVLAKKKVICSVKK